MQSRFETIQIKSPDRALEKRIKENWDHVAKPLDGLGEFEGLLARIGAIQGTENIDIAKKAVIVMCADNGIVEEGVSQSGQEVTRLVAECMGQNKSSVGKLAAIAGAEVIPVDIGIAGEETPEGVLNRKVRMGTANFRKCEAMTEEEAVQALKTGIAMVKECKERDYKLLGTGEMGIGNTTTSSTMAAALLGCPAGEVTGRGAGLSDEGLCRKIDIIEEALTKYGLRKESSSRKTENNSRQEAFRTLCAVGGLDIAGLAGVFIGGALYHVPVVSDGIISNVAALTAERLCPGVKEYVIPSHKSREKGAAKILEELGLNPVIDAGLALGEGTGAVMMFSLLDLALGLYESQTTFEEIALKPYERFDKAGEDLC